MGILDSICCCSCDTVCRDEPSKTHVVRAAAIKTETVEQPEVEPIDLSAVEVDDEVIEDEAVPETSEEQQTTRKYGSLSKKPLKDLKSKTGRRKIILRGAAAAVPPCSAEECVGEIPKVTSSKVALGGGAYLVYTSEENGSLIIKFTRTKLNDLHGVLAYIKPSTEFSLYHYTDNDGTKTVATNLQRALQSEYVSDRKAFYEAWCTFLKLSSSGNGTLYLLEASRLSPPPKVVILLYKDGAIHTAEPLTGINVRDYSIVGVLPHMLDHTTLEEDLNDRVKFPQACEEYGAVLII